jgi:hypothetical protein
VILSVEKVAKRLHERGVDPAEISRLISEALHFVDANLDTLVDEMHSRWQQSNPGEQGSGGSYR